MGNHSYVFVYGTLKRGYGNNERCLDGTLFIGEALSVEANFVMQRVGFPIIWQDPEDKTAARVRGEIFEIGPKHMAMCDRLEGHPRMYKREQRDFTVAGPIGVLTAWVYLWQGKHCGDKMEPGNGAYEWKA